MSDPCREAFEKAGYWPNEVMWKAWQQAWAEALRTQSETAAIVAPLNPSAMEQKTVDTVTRDAARYRFRHSNYVDKDGYEYGYCKVRWKGGAVESMLWADDAEIDAAMAASGEPMIKDGPHREESTVPQVGVCQRCGVNRFQAACPNGHMAETTGQCPMVAIAAERPA